MGNKKKYKGRKKNDIIIKYNMIKLLRELTGEELKYMLQTIIIEQDTEDLRYEHDNERIKEIFKKQDEEDIKTFNELLLKNPSLINKYSMLSGQITHSKNSFLNWQNQDNKKDDITTDDENEDEIIEESINFKNKEKPIVIKYLLSNVSNVPNQEIINDLLYEFSEETLIQMLIKGNMEKWERHYEDILIEIQEEYPI